MEEMKSHAARGPLLAAALAILAAAPASAQAHHHGSAAEAAARCDISAPSARAACATEDYLLALLDRDGVARAMAELEALAASDEEIRRDGHGYAHAIGISAYTGDEEVGTVFAQCTPAFQSGCYHGVIQSYFVRHGSMRDGRFDPEPLNALCREQREDADQRWLLFQCAHGMGHGLVMQADYHLPTALGGCDLVRDAWERESCYGGVFMENVVHVTVPHHAIGRPEGAAGGGAGDHADHAAHAAAPQHAAADHSDHADHAAHQAAGAHAPQAGADHAHHDAHADHIADPQHAHHADADHSAHADHAAAAAPVAAREPFPPLRREDPLYPCNALDERYLLACYQMQTSAILFFNGYDVAAAGRECARAPDLFRGTCFQSLGRDVSSITQQDHSRAIRLCGTVPADDQSWCHIGYAKNLVDLTADAEDGFVYCRLLGAGEFKRACHIAVGEQIWVLEDTHDRREALCAGAEPGYLSACRYGAGLPEDEVAGRALSPLDTADEPFRVSNLPRPVV